MRCTSISLLENILRELMYYYSEQNNRGDVYRAKARKDNRVIGIFSPVDAKAIDTVFALTLGQILAESQTCFISEHGRVFRNDGVVHGGTATGISRI